MSSDDGRARQPPVAEAPANANGLDLRSSPTEEIEGYQSPVDELRRPTVAACWSDGDVVFGRYRVVSGLGAGGFSHVVRAEDLSTGCPVALKFLAHSPTAQPVLARMKRELRLARDLRHPNIVRVYELLSVEGEHCLVMEYVEGTTLKSMVVNQGPLPVPRALELLGGLSSALAAVHAAGIVHRDLKPQNVMVTPQGIVKLLDFGLARTRESSGLTATGTLLGTPDYMSPEQVDGQRADERSDVYSLGIIAYELLVGRPPFAGDTPIAVALQHTRSRVPDPRKERPEIPASVARLVMSLTDPVPERRPASARGALVAVERLRESPSSVRAVPYEWRRVVRWAAAAVAGIAVAGGVLTRLAGRGAGLQPAGGPFSDGVVVAAVMASPGLAAGPERWFVEAAADAASTRLAGDAVIVRDVAEDARDPRDALQASEVEHVVEIGVDSELRGVDLVYTVRSRALEVASGEVWLEMALGDFTTLDFEAVDEVSSDLAEQYLDAVAAALAHYEAEAGAARAPAATQ